VVDALRSDGTVAGRFWIDRRTGLLLRTDVLDLEGRLARSAAFVQVTLGNPHRVGTMNVPPGSVEPSAWPQTLGPTELSDLRRRDWCVRASLPDGLVLYDARMGRANAAQVLQLGYSDGLSTVSVFEQRGRLNAGRLHGWQQTRAGGMPVWQQGVFPQRVVWSAGGLVYTVLADAPASEVTDAVSALPHHSRSPGVWQRVWHGLRRIGSWLDPFH
jgi:sigma-E factor negative regulatory protein RseB